MSNRKTDAEIVESIQARTVDVDGCWIWQKFATRNGYGQTIYRGKGWRVHRLMYHLCVGPIPEGHDVCHTCDVRLCVNPAHLWTGTRKQNMEDCLEKERHDSMKRTHCPRGHEYTPENTAYKPPTQWRDTPARFCKQCNLGRNRIRAGWPEALAYSMPATHRGKRPMGASWKHLRKA